MTSLARTRVETPSRPIPRRANGIRPLPRLSEDQRWVVGLSLRGLGLLVMLVLSVMGLDAAAGKIPPQALPPLAPTTPDTAWTISSEDVPSTRIVP